MSVSRASRLVIRGLLLLLAALATAAGAARLSAQPLEGASVRGTVLSDSTKSPLEFVEVMLLRAADSTLERGTSTDSTGSFVLTGMPQGEYLIGFSLIGYIERTTSRFTIDARHRRVSLSPVTLSSSAVNLEEVTVTAERSPIVSSIDRLTYNVDQDIVNKAASASELLENIPSVQVDLNGEVSLRGSKRVLMMINGKRSPILERQEGTFLEQLPATAIEKIEVITTPSAKYRAEGKSGIINIVLKKDTPVGTHGNLTSHVSGDGRYNAHARINHSPGSFNLYGTYSIRKDNRNRVNEDVRDEATHTDPNTVSSIYTDRLYAFADPVTHMATVGFDDHIDSSQSFGISGSYLHNSFTRFDSSYRLLQSPTGIPLTEYTRIDTGDEVDREYSVALNYHRTFGRQDHRLRIEGTASRSPETDEYRFTNTYLSPTFPSTYDRTLNGPRDDKSSLGVEYSNALSPTCTVEAGYMGELNRTDLNFSAEDYDPIARIFVTNTAKSSRFRYTEAIHSVYTTVKQSFGSLGVLAGGRIERAAGWSDLESIDSSRSSSYWNFFPSLHLSQTLSKTTELRLSYSRRISRPKAKDLDPFPEFRDPKNVSFGNPSLVPEYIHSVELGCQIQSKRLYMLPSFFFRYASDDISPIKRIVNRTTLQTTRENVSWEQSLGMELIVSWRAGDLFSVRLSSTGLYDRLNAANVGGGEYKSNLSWSGTFTGNLNFSKDSRFELHTHWNSLRLTPQGDRLPNAVVNLGYRQQFFEDRLSLTATLSDAFKTLKRRDELFIPRLAQSVVNTRESRVVYFGFTYRLGTAPKKTGQEEFHYDDDDE